MYPIDKIPVFDWFYEQGDVYITVLTKSSDLLNIPPQSRQKELETFVVGAVPTPQLTYNDDGVNALMRFGERVHKCFLPWESIIMIAGQNAVIQFVVSEKSGDEQGAKADKKRKIPARKTGKIKKNKPHLQVVK